MADEQKPDSFKLYRARLSFPHIWKAKSVNEGDEPKFSAAFILEKKEHEELITLIKTTMWKMAVEKFGGSDKAKDLVHKKKLHFALHEGSEKSDLDGYNDGNMFLSSSSSKRPHVIDRDKTPLTEDDRKPYGGCFVNAAVRFWVQDNNFGKRVNCELLAVQFVADGEAFGAPPFNVDEEFEDLDAGKGKGGKGKSKEKEKAPSGASSEPDEDEIPF